MSPQTQTPGPDSIPVTYDESVQELYDINKAVAQKYNEFLMEVLKDSEHPVSKYLNERNVSQEDVQRWKLGFAPKDWRFITTPLENNKAFERGVDASVCVEKDGKKRDFFHNRLIIPLIDEQCRIISFTGRSLDGQEPKYLNTRESPIFKKSELLFGIDKAFRSIARSKEAVLTEGNFDVISLHRYGVNNAVGKGGTALTDAQLALLKRQAEVVILIYDIDPSGAGQLALQKDCDRLLEAGLRVQIFHLPHPGEGNKIDADSWLQQVIKAQSDQKPRRLDIANYIRKSAKDGLMWLAESWHIADDLASQVAGEKRSVELMAKVQDGVWLKKYANRLAGLFGCRPTELIKGAQRIRQAPEKEDDEDDEDEQAIRMKTVQYRKDGSIMVYGNKNWVCVADNFQIFIAYKTETENQEVSWILEIRKKHQRDDSLFIEVIHEEFCSANKLKVKLAGCDLAFKITDTYIGELHQHLFTLGYPRAVKVTRLGYHEDSGVYFFANKAMNGKLLDPNDHGIVSCLDRQGETVHLVMPQIGKNIRKNRIFFQYSESNITFNRWFEQMTTVHKYDNVIIPASFYLMALYRDVVIKYTNTCPMLYLKGGASSGKSSIVRSMCQLFGFKEPAANLKSRVLEAALIRKMSQLSNSLIWLEEMNNEFELKGVLQAAYDNTGYSRSSDSTSIETNSVDIYSAIAITSNYLLDDEILFTRCVFIPIIEQQKTEQQAIDYKILDDLQANGLACVTIEMLQHRELIEQNFRAYYEKLYNRIHQALKHDKIVVRLISNMAQVLTIAYILQIHGKVTLMEFGDEESILNEFVSIGVNVIVRQHQIAAEKSNLNEFFEIIQNQYEMGYLQEGMHYVFQGEQVWLRFPALYRIYFQRYRMAFGNKLPADRDTLKNEMLSFEGYTDVEKHHFFRSWRFAPLPAETSNDKTRSVSDCCAMTYSKLQNTFGLELEFRKDTNRMR